MFTNPFDQVSLTEDFSFLWSLSQWMGWVYCFRLVGWVVRGMRHLTVLKISICKIYEEKTIEVGVFIDRHLYKNMEEVLKELSLSCEAGA